MLGDIADGTLKPGERVSEQAYSQRCMVSRTPVRQALKFLQRLRVVSMKARLGARVQLDAAAAKKLLASPSFARKSGNGAGVEPEFVNAARKIRSLLAGMPYDSSIIIKDAAIARQIGVSRTTANRALGLLARQNLLQPLPRRGWRRVVLGPKEIIDLYDFRLVIEPAALESAWEHLDLTYLKDLLERTRAAIAPGTRRDMDETAMVELDMELHHAILQSCANPLLRRAMEEQEALRVIAVAPSWRVSARSEATFREHVAILDAICGRARKPALAALRSHLLMARNYTAQRLAEQIESSAEKS
jgi:DNA-binding GntR family transcriptional regulator